MRGQSHYAENRDRRGNTALQKTGSIILLIIRLTLAVVFIFSGFVKAIDPLGSTYKIEDYLFAFGEPFSQFTSLAFAAAIALSTFELLLGLAFLLRIKLRTTSVLALLLMMVMLPLTLFIAIKDPVTDCGCFGDALVISNWSTFYKNVIITLFIVILLIFSNRIRRLLVSGAEWMAIAIFVIFGVALSLFSYRHLPFIDFRPYKVGVNIPEAMEVPEGMPVDKYDTKLVYEKDGVQQEFTLESYPQNDSSWVFVEQNSILIEKGYTPPIHDFDIVDENGFDITDELLSHPGKVHFIIMYDLDKADITAVAKAEELYKEAKSRGELFYALTASSDEDIRKFAAKHALTFSFCLTDPITLKTIVRANPGLMTIENGTIINKKNLRNL